MRFQKTLRREAVIEGVGVHTGERARLVCRPADEGSGISVSRVDLAGQPRWRLTGGAESDEAAESRGAGRRTL